MSNPVTDPRAAAQRILNMLDDAARQLTMNPEAQIPLMLLGPSEAFTADILVLVDHATKVPAASANGQYPQEQQQAPPPYQQEQPQQQGVPAQPTQAGVVRSSFTDSVRSSGMYPQASDATVPPPMLATMVRIYIMGRMDEVKRSSGGWKVCEQWQREYQYVFDPSWVPDQSWKWWIAPVQQAQPFRMAGGFGSSVASHMAQAPQW